MKINKFVKKNIPSFALQVTDCGAGRVVNIILFTYFIGVEHHWSTGHYQLYNLCLQITQSRQLCPPSSR